MHTLHRCRLVAAASTHRQSVTRPATRLTSSSITLLRACAGQPSNLVRTWLSGRYPAAIRVAAMTCAGDRPAAMRPQAVPPQLCPGFGVPDSTDQAVWPARCLVLVQADGPGACDALPAKGSLSRDQESRIGPLGIPYSHHIPSSCHSISQQSFSTYR
jgi:hypothetical protein